MHFYIRNVRTNILVVLDVGEKIELDQLINDTDQTAFETFSCRRMFVFSAPRFIVGIRGSNLLLFQMNKRLSKFSSQLRPIASEAL